MRIRWLAVTCAVACRAAPTVPDARAPAGPGQACSSNRVGEVRVSGAPRELVPQLTVLEGTLDDPARTERIAAIATGALRSRGYADAALTVRRRTRCGVALDVAVALGPRFRIAAIAFDTDDEFPAAERLAVLEDGLGTVNTVGGVYIAYRMTRALAELQRRYRDAGWLDAVLGTPRASYDPDGTVSIAIPVAAGRRFRIGKVVAVGAPAARHTVLHALGLRAGEFYDGPRIRTAIERARYQLARWIELRERVAAGRSEVELEAIVEAR